jgi:hypothetical protein
LRQILTKVLGLFNCNEYFMGENQEARIQESRLSIDAGAQTNSSAGRKTLPLLLLPVLILDSKILASN